MRTDPNRKRRPRLRFLRQRVSFKPARKTESVLLHHTLRRLVDDQDRTPRLSDEM